MKNKLRKLLAFSLIFLSVFSVSVSGISDNTLSVLKAQALTYDNRFNYLFNGNGISITGCNDYYCYGEILIPKEIDGYTVTEIYEKAFDGCYRINSIIIPDTVKKIGKEAFYNCYNLEKIILPDSIEFLGYNAFAETEYYEDVENWENGVLYIGNHLISGEKFEGEIYEVKKDTKTICSYAFSHHTLKKIIIPDGVTHIGNYAFGQCSKLSDITLPDSIVYIGKDAFSYTEYFYNEENRDGAGLYIDNHLVYVFISNLSSGFEVKNGTKTIAAHAFYSPKVDFTKVVIPSSIRGIGEEAFGYCTKLNEIIYSGSLEEWCGIIFFGDNANPMANTASISFNHEIDWDDFVIPDSIKKINDYAFYYFSEIRNLKISDSVESIGDYAFTGCYRIKSLTVPGSVKFIGKKAFGNIGVKSVVFEKGVISIGDKCFESCGYLTSIKFSETVKRIGDNAFESCTDLVKVTIPGNVKEIGKEAFKNCTTLYYLTIEDGVEIIKGHAFEKTLVNEVSLPQSITDLGWWIFYDTPLNTVKIDCVTDNFENAFYQCKIKKIIIGKNLDNVKPMKFYLLEDLNSIQVDSENQHFSSSNGVLYNKDKTCLIQCPKNYGLLSIPGSVEIIDELAFWCNEKITSISLNSDLKKIGRSAFYRCINLNKVYNLSAEVIEENAFYDCYNITYIDFQEGIKYIGRNAFDSCCISELTIPASVEIISDNAFNYCNSLSNIKIIDTVEYIGTGAFKNTKFYGDKNNWTDGFLYIDNHLIAVSPNEVSGIPEINENTVIIADYAFSDCENITEVSIPDNVTHIGNNVFSGCNNLNRVYIGSSLEYIGEYAFGFSDKMTNFEVDPDNNNFSNDENGVLFNKDKSILIQFPSGSLLTSYSVPIGVKTIGSSAFTDHRKIIDITLPDTLKEISDNAFSNCVILNNIVIPYGVKTIGDRAFFNCESFTDITVPDSVTYLGERAFCGCSNLKNVILSKNITQISNHLFSYCDLIEIVLPEGIESIGEFAFAGNEFTELILPDSVKSVGRYAFESCLNLDFVHFPESVNEIGERILLHYNSPDTYEDVNISAYICVTNDKCYAAEYALGNRLWLKVCKGHHEHSYNSLITKAPNCRDEGELTFSCACGETYTEPIPVTGIHKSGTWETVVEPTETTEGKKVFKCNLCLTVLEEAIIPVVIIDKPKPPEEPLADDIIKQPSQNVISYGDAIVLHIDSSKIPTGGRVEWIADNSNFTYNATGEFCVISPNKSGETVFTAIVYDSEGFAVLTDSQKMKSKAGFFDKIIAFFKQIFGLTKTIPQLFN